MRIKLTKLTKQMAANHRYHMISMLRMQYSVHRGCTKYRIELTWSKLLLETV